MAVKCLSGVDKNSIVYQFTQLNQSIASLSYEYKKSRRTIIRVLEEYGIDAGTKRRSVTQNSPETTAQKPELIKTRTPWYEKAKYWLTKPMGKGFFLK